MKVKNKYGSQEEITRNELENPNSFEGGRPAIDISALAKKMKEYDPDASKALKLAKKYREEEQANGKK